MPMIVSIYFCVYVYIYLCACGHVCMCTCVSIFCIVAILHWSVPWSYILYLMTIMFLKCLFPPNWTFFLTPFFSHTLHIVCQNNFLAQISNCAHNQSIFHLHRHHLELTTIISPLDYYNCLLIQLFVSTLVSLPGWTYITHVSLSLFIFLSSFFFPSLPLW